MAYFYGFAARVYGKGKGYRKGLEERRADLLSFLAEMPVYINDHGKRREERALREMLALSRWKKAVGKQLQQHFTHFSR